MGKNIPQLHTSRKIEQSTSQKRENPEIDNDLDTEESTSGSALLVQNDDNNDIEQDLGVHSTLLHPPRNSWKV